MCRLPLDLMTRIIEMVRVPLPCPGDPRVTWSDLRQQDLATLMRTSRVSCFLLSRMCLADISQITYFIAAPLLYKEVVVNNLSSFFLGVDDDLQSHHDGCLDVQSRQTRICDTVVSKRGRNYHCPRHIVPHQTDTDTVNDHDSERPGFFHKQQLLRLVKGVHFIYSSADRHMYGNVRIEDHINDDGAMDTDVIHHLDLGRYLNIPDCIKSGHLKPLPNLWRLTVAAWLGQSDIAPIIESHSVWYQSEASARYRQLEKHLAGAIYLFPSVNICRYPANGFLACYPPPSAVIAYNAIHETDLATYGTQLRVGADNLVYITDKYKDRTPFELFSEECLMIAEHLLEAGWTWRVGISEFEDTHVTFVIERSMEQDYCQMTDEEFEEEEKDMDDLREMFRAELASTDPFDHWNDGMWEIEWVEAHLFCKACEPIWHQTYKTALGISPSPSSSSSLSL